MKILDELMTQELKVFLRAEFEDNFNRIETKMESVVNLKSYSINEASKVTGFGFSKIRTAIIKGILPATPDGKSFKITHMDLFHWVNNGKNGKPKTKK